MLILKTLSKEHLLAQISSLITNRSMVRDYFASSPLVHIVTVTPKVMSGFGI